MTKRITTSLSLCVLIFISSFASSCNTCPYLLKTGTYGFTVATITDTFTHETTEICFDDIANDSNTFIQWGYLLDFHIYIDENTTYYRKEDDTYFVLNDSFAFEIIEPDTLRLHFSHWSGYDLIPYDVSITLGWQPTYI